MKIVWLSSYPRSGNTWLRFFLQCYYFGRPDHSSDIGRYFPDLHVPGELENAEPVNGRLIVKTHQLFGLLHPYANWTEKFIYILRHPKDVLLSNYNYVGLTDYPDCTAQQFTSEFILNHGMPYWRHKAVGSWPEHVRNWCGDADWLKMQTGDDSQFPGLILRYEDMKRDPHAHFSRVIKFLDGNINKDRLNNAINQSSIESMREYEDKETGKSRVFHKNDIAREQGKRFINGGTSGNNLNHIGKTYDYDFNSAFSPYLTEYGY